MLGLGAVDEDELYRALDLLGEAQPRIEAALARRHLEDGCLVLYDLTSSWLEGRCCELARFGYSRDGKRDKLQIVFGLLCSAEGCPSLFDQRDLAEITSPDYPGERLVVCRNPGLAAERARKRAALLAATEQDLARIRAATSRARRPLRGQGAIALRVGAVLGRRKVAKHFSLTITDGSLSFARDEAAIAKEAALDGFYVVRTSLPAATLDAAATVSAYKSLAQVERAFRSLKTVDLEVRPIHHRLPKSPTRLMGVAPGRVRPVARAVARTPER